MLSQLLRVASEAGAFAGTVPDIGPTATTTNVRPVNAGYIDGRAHPEMGMGNQLDSFRGTLYAAVDKIARRTAQIPGRLVQMELENGEDPLETIIHLHPYVTLFSDMNGHKPHPEYSVWEIKYILQVSLDLTGEGWWLVERDSFGVPSKITPLPALPRLPKLPMTLDPADSHTLLTKVMYLVAGAVPVRVLHLLDLRLARQWRYLHSEA